MRNRAAVAVLAAAAALGCARRGVILVHPGGESWPGLGGARARLDARAAWTAGRREASRDFRTSEAAEVVLQSDAPRAAAGRSTQTLAGAGGAPEDIASESGMPGIDVQRLALAPGVFAAGGAIAAEERSAASLGDGSRRLHEGDKEPARGFSPARPRGPAAVGRVAASSDAPPGDAGAAPSLGGGRGPPRDVPDMGQLDSDFAGYVMRMAVLTGGVRVQLSPQPDFARIAFDQRFDFAEDFNADAELRRRGLRAGLYWARMALIDLLGYQFPYTAAKKYQFLAEGRRAVAASARSSH